ncbi:MAG: hypothetical protein Q8P68_00245 [Candidatus Peregrinibacteria bacterium]|nr:hypothetical protein [Candidatus Peregrinibacteria bacterium]MDZ4244599.1 hypothetical protein [Candidatus Gracilibacteria bacterium]
MLYKRIIRDAWRFTQEQKRLVKWYALFPAILTTIAGILFIVYQYMAFVTSEALFAQHSESFLYRIISVYIKLFDTNTKLGITVTVFLIIAVIMHLFIPVFCQGALIQLIARHRNGDPIKVRNGISHGLLNFLPLFEYSLILRSFTLTSILGEGAFILRNFGWGWFEALIVPIIMMICVSMLLTLFFTYSEYFMVIDKKKVFASMKSSTLLVIKHWQHTFLILILMLIIGLRILINVLIVLIIPGVIIGIVAIFVYSAALMKVGVIVGGLAGIFALYIASYFNAILDVWAKAIWVYSFLELTTQKEIDARGNIMSGNEALDMEDTALT